jgi:DNA-binding LytR/AlgR family response regulator
MEGYLLIYSGHSQYSIELSEILYIKGDNKLCQVKTATRTYTTSLTMAGLEARLPQEHFVRVHKRYIVSLRSIKEIRAFKLYVGNEVVPLARRKVSEFQSKFIMVEKKRHV